MNEFPLGKTIVDWVEKQLPSLVRKQVQSVGGLRWVGVYTVGQRYSRGDMCRFNSSLYVALGDTTDMPKTDSTVWDFML